MPALFKPTHDQIVAALEREIKMRERVYPTQVYKGKMSQAHADHEIACIKAALEVMRENVDS